MTRVYTNVEMSVAILLQEFDTGRHMYGAKKQWAIIRFLWVASSMFIIMGFSGNLKSSFVKQKYEDRTMTLNEMIDKDLTIYTSTEMAEYFEVTKETSPINRRMLCQSKKKNSFYTNRY